MKFKPLTLLALALFMPATASAAIISAGGLSINVESIMEFNDIFLHGNEIDGSTFVQGQFANGLAPSGTASAVVVTGNSASYTNTIAGFDLSVTSTILGALASNPGNSSVFEQQFTFTNNSGGILSLESVSLFDHDLLDSGGDTTAYDSGTNAVFAFDTNVAPTVFAAAIADDSNATFGWNVGLLGGLPEPTPFSSLTNNSGPAGPDDTEMAVGLDFGEVAPGASATLRYRYLFATDITSVPADFNFSFVPEPSHALLSLVGLTALGLRRRRT